MSRKRQIDPGIWTSEQFINLADPWARLLFIGIISNADDEGRIKAGALYLKAIIFPADAFTLEQVAEWRSLLVRQGLVIVYTCDGKDYIQLPTWGKYQYTSKPYPSKLPAPPESQDVPAPVANHSATVPAPVANHSRTSSEPFRPIGIGIGIGIGNDNDIGNGEALPPSPPVKPKTQKLVTPEYLTEMVSEFPTLNVDRIYRLKFSPWCKQKGKQETQRRFVDWLEKDAQEIEAERKTKQTQGENHGRPTTIIQGEPETEDTRWGVVHSGPAAVLGMPEAKP